MIATFFFVLGFILQPKIQHETNYYINIYENKSNLRKAGKLATEQILDRELLRSYRIVRADILYIRKSASVNSPIMGQLYYGNVVQVIEKKRNWSLIIWQDANNDILIQGWVFTRYIKPLT